jgi:hypothetical protein
MLIVQMEIATVVQQLLHILIPIQDHVLLIVLLVFIPTQQHIHAQLAIIHARHVKILQHV